MRRLAIAALLLGAAAPLPPWRAVNALDRAAFSDALHAAYPDARVDRALWSEVRVDHQIYCTLVHTAGAEPGWRVAAFIGQDVTTHDGFGSFLVSAVYLADADPGSEASVKVGHVCLGRAHFDPATAREAARLTAGH